MQPSRLPILFLTVCWIKGGRPSPDKVSQTPTDVLVKANSEVTLTLSHKIPNYDTILWYRRSPGDSALTLMAYMYYNNPKYEPQFENRVIVKGNGENTVHLEIGNATHRECTGEYFGAARDSLSTAEAYFGGGTKLTVLEAGINVTAPTRVKVLSPSEKECSSGKKTLVCVASGFYPDHVSVSWMINEETVSKGVATDSAATRYGTSYRITSRLTVSSEEWTSDNKFICSVSFFNGTTTTYHNDSITGEAKKSPSGTELSRDKYLRITQSAKLSYIIFIVKSCIYGAFIWFVAWKLQSLAEKKRKR